MVRRRRMAAPVRPNPAKSIAQDAGSGTPPGDPSVPSEAKEKLPEIAGCGLPERSDPVCVNETVRDAGADIKLLSDPAGVKLPRDVKLTTALGAGAVIRFSIVPMKVPKLLVKPTDAPFVAVTVEKLTGVKKATDDMSPVELVTNPPAFDRTDPAPMPNVDDVIPKRPAEKVPSIVAARDADDGSAKPAISAKAAIGTIKRVLIYFSPNH